MTPRPAADRTRRSSRPETERAPAQEVEGTEEGRPVVVEVDENSPPQKIEGHAGGEPVEVKFAEDGREREPRRARLVTRESGQSLAPDTTEEADRVTEGQRRTSLLWEAVQAIVAFMVTGTTLYVLAVLALVPDEPTSNQLQVVSHLMVMTTLILTFYFQRTNHTRIGGVGVKANEIQEYRGR